MHRPDGMRANADRLRAARVVIAIGLVSLHASPAAAHTGTGLPGGFVSGFLHPLKGLDHLLAMVSVGVWGAFLGRPLIFVLPVVFPALMVVGAIAGMFGVSVPRSEAVVALSVLVLGSCVALAIEAPIACALLIVAVFGIFHGYAHGRELPSAADPVGYSAGFVLVTGLLHLSGIGLGGFNDRAWGIAMTRGIGVAIALCGVWFLQQAIAS
jgi:urease accessory protein